MSKDSTANKGFNEIFNPLDFINTVIAELMGYNNIAVAVYEPVDDGNDFIFKDFSRAAERIDCIKTHRFNLLFTHGLKIGLHSNTSPHFVNTSLNFSYIFSTLSSFIS